MKSRVLLSGYLFYVLSYVYFVSTASSSRQRRYLVFTSSTQWGAFVTLSVPLHPEATASAAWFFEANFYNVANSSYFEPLLGDGPALSRTDRSIRKMENTITRQRLYEAIEALLEKHRFPGRACLLRSICETARSHYSYNGLVGDLLHLILTTSVSISEDDLSDCYYEAEYRGLEHDCSFFYEDCPQDPLDQITMYIEKLL